MPEQWRRDYQPDFRCHEVYMEVILGVRKTLVSVQYKISPTASHNKPLILRGDNQWFKLTELRINDIALTDDKVQMHSDSLIIPEAIVAQALQDDNVFTVSVRSWCCPEENNSGEGIYVPDHGYLVYQGEMSGMPKVTYCLDGPHQTAIYTVKLIGDKTLFPTMLANGTLIESAELSDNQHYVVWQEKDILYSPIYFGLFAGKYVEVTDNFIYANGKQVKISVLLTEEAKKAQCHHAIDALKKALAYWERQYNKHYPLDTFIHVLVPKFNAGAMEIPGRNSFNALRYLADHKLHTDGEMKHTFVIVCHEFIHWFLGHEVGCKTLLDMTAKEGMTTFFEIMLTEHEYPDHATRIQALRTVVKDVFAEMKGPAANALIPINISSLRLLYAAFRYEGSAQVMKSLQAIVDIYCQRGVFIEAFKVYLERYKHQHVTPLEIIDVVAEISNVNLEQFKLWYTEPGLPCLRYKSHYDTAQKQLTLTVEQYCRHPKFKDSYQPRMIPLQLAFFGKKSMQQLSFQDGEQNQSVDVTNVILTQSKQVFVFSELDEDVEVSLRWHNALVEIEDDSLQLDALYLLGKHDTNLAHRWYVIQKLFEREFEIAYSAKEQTGIIKSLRKCLPSLAKRPNQYLVSANFIAVIQSVLADARISPATKAELLFVPTEMEMARFIDTFEPERVHHVREQMIRDIALALRDTWCSHYRMNEVKQPYQHEMQQIGMRAMRNLSLFYLIRLNESSFSMLAMRQYQQANNMTEQYAALSYIVRQQCRGYQDMISEYCENYGHDDACVYRWLRLIACVGELELVKKTANSGRFDLTVPNHLKALLRSFATENWRFHQENGSGYAWIIQSVLKIDQEIGNSDTASAIFLSAFESIQDLDATRQLIIKNLIQAMPMAKLSKDLKEAVTNTLAVIT